MSDNDKKKNTNQPDKSKSGKNNEIVNMIGKRRGLFEVTSNNSHKDKS